MSFVDPTQNPNDQNQNPSQVDKTLSPTATQNSSGQPTSQEAPPSTSAGGAGIVYGASNTANAASASAAPAKPSSSGSWTNLESYLNANADQGAQVGQQIAETVNNQGNQAQNDITNLGVNFKSAVDQNTINQDQNSLNNVINAATSAKAGQTLTQDQIDAYNKQANANYGGPTDPTAFNGYDQAQRDINSASQLAQQTQSEAGRGTLLQNRYQNASVNGYTQGENNLDQLLLQNSQGGQTALQPLAQQWSGLTGALNNTVSTGSNAAQAAVATDQATSQAAKGALSTASQNFQNQLATGLAALQKKNTGAYNQVVNDLRSGTLTPDEAALIGVDPNQHNYGLDQTSYLTQNAAPTLQQYANADQYAQAAALAQLAGQTSFLAPDNSTNPQAGTAQNIQPYSFDSAKYNSDNTAKQAEYANNQANMLRVLNQGYIAPGGENLLVGESPTFTSMPQAVQLMNVWINLYGNLPPSTGAGSLAAWSKKQLEMINQSQQAYGFPTYPGYAGSAPPTGK